ncbi:MAG TPA: vWA domain-containing protein [Planctomycetota bacterium]|nr:vWA domain-containing protein [Planctomycetota bacterium]
MSRVNPGRPAPGARKQSLPIGPQSAVERLEQIKDHQWSFMDDVVNNWQGWLGSLLFHGGLIILFGAITWKIMEEKQDYWLETDLMQSEHELTKESLDDLFDDSPVDSEIDEPPSVDADVMRPNPGYTELDPGAPNYITSGGHLTGLGQGGGGGDHLAGKSWGGYIRGLQRSGLDIMFVFDSTGSMGGIILEVKTRIRQLMKVVAYLVPNAQLGLVTYRDKKKYDLDDYEYTVKFVPLMKGNKEGLDKLQRFLRETEAYGGGDIPEAVFEGVGAAINKAGWNKSSKKIIIVFGDAPPRPESNGLAKIYDLCKSWHERTEGVVSCIDTTGGSKLLDEFRQMAADGGGESIFLNDERAIIKQLVVFIFGTKWEKEIDKVYSSVLKGPEDTIIGE